MAQIPGYTAVVKAKHVSRVDIRYHEGKGLFLKNLPLNKNFFEV